MEGPKLKKTKVFMRDKGVVHAKVGTEYWEILDELALRQGTTHTQVLRNLLDEAREKLAEDVFAPRLESLARTLLGMAEQQARHAHRIEAVVAILRKAEEGQIDRESQILQTQNGVAGLTQLIYAYLLAIAETSPRAADIARSAQVKMLALREES